MKKTYWIVAGAFVLIFLKYKDLIIGGFLFLLSLLLFAGSFLLITWYVGRTTYKNNFSPEAKIRQQEEKEKYKNRYRKKRIAPFITNVLLGLDNRERRIAFTFYPKRRLLRRKEKSVKVILQRGEPFLHFSFFLARMEDVTLDDFS